MQLNPEQQRVVESDSRCRVVIAGPGSGKTRTLVEAIAKLIRDGTPSRAIAAVTFTNAAARELERRIQETFFNNTLRLGYCGTLHGLLLRWIQATSDNRLSIADEQQTEAMLAESIARLRFTGTKEAVRELLMRGPQFAPGRSLTRTELVAADFWQTMQSAGLLDFDAILHRGLRLLRDGAAGREFTHLFVDETQDSGEMDALIYDAMPTPLKTFFGDSDQSVYGFRGGRPEYLMRLARSEASATFYLRGNYRCGSAICAAANRLIENNTDRLDKWTVSATEVEGVVSVGRFDDQPAEIAGVAMMIQKVIANGVSASECAVLLRTNKLVDAYSEGIAAMGIPVHRRKVTERPAGWRDAMRLLSLSANPFNDFLMFDWISSSDGIEAAERARRTAAERLCSLNELLDPPWPECASIAEAVARLTLTGFGLCVVEQVEQVAAALPPDAELSELIVALSVAEPVEDAGDGVTVCTMHTAKGREWEFVALPAFEQGIIPARRDLAEERRLAFVAFTRAKNCLVVSSVASRVNPYKHVTEATEPSQFIAEAGIPDQNAT